MAEKKSLTELGSEFVELLELSEDGEITDEEFEDAMDNLTKMIDGKIDSWLSIAFKMKARGKAKQAYAKALQEEYDKIKKSGDADIRHADRMYDVVMSILELQGVKKFEGDYMKATIKSCPPTVEYDCFEDIPSQFLIPQEPKVDAKALKNHLLKMEKEGKSCEYARLKRNKILLVG